MSAKKQEPKILNTTDFQPDGFKWTRLKKIDWEDETGRKVSQMPITDHKGWRETGGELKGRTSLYREYGKPLNVPLEGRPASMVCMPREETSGSVLTAFWTAVAIVALLDHPSKPLSTVILEQYRPPIGNTCIGKCLLP